MKQVLQGKHIPVYEKECMEAILASMNIGLALINCDMSVVWANAQYRKLFPWGDPVGKKCHAFAENRAKPCVGCQAIKAFQDGTISEHEQLNSINGRWYQVITLPIKGQQDQGVNVIEAVTDITDHKLMDERLAQQRAEINRLKERLEAENIYLRQGQTNDLGFRHIIGQSDAIKYVLYRVQQVAPTDTTVLIMGETGTGKGRIARVIQDASLRKDKPFVTVNCAALPGNLIESELFGREKGAFTGAEAKQVGRFELADGGTIFLDEIVDMPIELQIKLLRVIEEGVFERLGSPHPVKVDVRIIASTNQNIQEALRARRFREDLFYRLNVFPITIPPLRQRLEDIELLSKFFLDIFNKQFRKQITGIPAQALHALQNYAWPGNVRELMSVIERGVIISTGPDLQLAETLTVSQDMTSPKADGKRLEEVQREFILSTLYETGWKIEGPGGAAQALGINPSTLRTRMKKFSIKRPKISR
jgi:formate hydrogenlyase transcriptional activator